MDMLKKALTLSVPAFLLCVGNSYAVPLDISPNRHTTFTNELESTDSYQIARAVFLPETSDDLGMSGRHFKSGYYSPDENCTGYDLTRCPDNWKCLDCMKGASTVYKTNGCKKGYELNEDETDCVKTKTEDCSKYQSYPWIAGSSASVCSARKYSSQASLAETCNGQSYIPCACPDAGHFTWNGTDCVCKKRL